MIEYKPEKIYIDEAIQHEALVVEVLHKFPHIRPKIISDAKEIIERVSLNKDPRTEGKRHLWLAKQKGKFVKPFPWSDKCLGYNYYVINIAANCHFECTYCILQSYLNNPLMVLYANVSDLFAELEQVLAQNPNKFYRMGTGELADSLAMDAITGYSGLLVPFFARQKNAVLEFKTKSTCIEGLLDLEHNGRVIVSWSLNSEKMAESEELKTASIEERLKAAALCQTRGYKVGFHFDPLIYYDDWEQGYHAVVKKLFELVDAERIAWVSLGTLRFPSEQKAIIRARFPKSIALDGELVPGIDGKMRYFKPMRIHMYSLLRAWIRKYGGERVPVYLCMETPEVWRKAFHWQSQGRDAVNRILDQKGV